MRRSSAESLGRTAALIAVGAFAVHQLRYLAGYGHEAGSELSRQGHGYLAGALPVLAAFLLSAVAAGLLRAALGRRAGMAAPTVVAYGRDTYGRRAALFGVAIALVFLSQESLEGAFSAGHPDGLAAVVARGGWFALPLAGLLGALCALLDRGLTKLEAAIAGGEAFVRTHPAPTDAPRPLPAALVPRNAAPLPFGIAGRPPPGLPLLQR
jgi:hypothetical protein